MEFLSQKGVPFTEKNIVRDESARQELIEKYNAMGVPVIVIDEQVIMGFDKGKVERALGLM